ncbi:hypothetical protein B0H14DRAFT_3858831, partial [Mycena olivaceomarginata]
LSVSGAAPLLTPTRPSARLSAGWLPLPSFLADTRSGRRFPIPRSACFSHQHSPPHSRQHHADLSCAPGAFYSAPTLGASIDCTSSSNVVRKLELACLQPGPSLVDVFGSDDTTPLLRTWTPRSLLGKPLPCPPSASVGRPPRSDGRVVEFLPHPPFSSTVAKPLFVITSLFT